MLRISATAIIILFFAGSSTASKAEDNGSEENEWLRYERKEQGLSSADRSARKDFLRKRQLKPAVSNEAPQPNSGSYQAPLYLIQQNKEEPRPQELIITGTSSTAATSPFNRTWLGPLSLPLSGFFGSRYGLGYGLGAAPYSGFLGPGYGGYGGYGLGAAPYVGGYRGAYGAGIIPFGGFYPGAGVFTGGLPGLYSPGRAALIYGPSFNSLSLNRPITTTRVFQSGPSPSSGNYYQPATTSAGASGGYYAASGTAVIPVTPSEPLPKDYWGPAGNPFGN